MGESDHDDSGQVHHSRERSNNKSSTGNSRHRNLTCNYYHKKEQIRADCWLRKKKQLEANITELIKEDEDKCDVLSITDRSAGKKDRWIIDFGCSHISVSIDVLHIHFSSRGRSFHGEFCYK